jgi:hypothetical protein
LVLKWLLMLLLAWAARSACIRGAPQPAQFGFVLEEGWQFAVEQFHELLGRHRAPVGVPEAGTEGIFDLAFLTIGQFYFDPGARLVFPFGFARFMLAGFGFFWPSHSGSLKWGLNWS